MQDGIGRGEIAADLAVDAFLDASIGAIYLRLLLGEPIGDAWLQGLTHSLLHGALIR
jgi:hypothetical protein